MSHRFVRRPNEDGYTADHKAHAEQAQRIYTNRTSFPMHEISRLIVAPGPVDGPRHSIMKAFVEFAEGVSK